MAAIRAYDFRRPVRLTRRNRPALTAFGERFASLAAVSLATMLRLPAHVRNTDVDATPRPELDARIGGVAEVVACSLGPARLMILVSPAAAGMIIERKLGGIGTSLLRPQLTALDRLFLADAVDVLIAAAAEAAGEQTPANQPPETDAGDEGEPVSFLFTLSAGGQLGTIALLLTGTGLPELIQRFVTRERESASATRSARPAGSVEGPLAEAPVTVKVALGTIRLAVQDLLDLQPGDVVTLDTPASGSATVLIDNHPSFRARPGIHRGRQAVRIIEE